MATSSGARSTAEQAVVDRAGKIAVQRSTPREIVTVVEDAALERVDRGVARQLVEIDRRLSRERDAILAGSPLGRGSSTRVVDDREPRPRTDGSSFPDAAGMMLSIVASAIVIAGSGRGATAPIPFDLSALLAGGAGLVATLLHAFAALRASSPRYRAPGTWKLLLFSAAGIWVAAGWLLVRQLALDESGLFATPAYLVLGLSGGATLVLAFLNLVRWHRLLRSVKGENASRDSRELDAALDALAESARLDAETRFERLPESVRQQFDGLVAVGLSSVGGPADSVAALRDLYRVTPRFGIRYSLE